MREKEINLGAGDGALFYSDGLVEADNPEGEMVRLSRLQALVAEHAGGVLLVDFLMDELYSFTGERWEQEDDITSSPTQSRPVVSSLRAGHRRSRK